MSQLPSPTSSSSSARRLGSVRAMEEEEECLGLGLGAPAWSMWHEPRVRVT